MSAPGGVRRLTTPGHILGRSAALVILGVLLAVAATFSAGLGQSETLGMRKALRILRGSMAGRQAPEPDTDRARALGYDRVDEAILLRIRLPRVGLGALIGALLSMAGAAFQGLLRNPLASPFTLGVSSGGALGAAVCMATGFAALGLWTLPLSAFVGAGLAVVVVYTLARVDGEVSIAGLVLAGIVVSSFFSALIGLIKALSSDQTLSAIVLWIMGSLNDPALGMEHIQILSCVLVLAGLPLLAYARAMDILSLGEESAAQNGVNVARLKAIAVACGALLAGSAVAFAGIIGFVGLVVPHLCRMLVGAGHACLYVACALLGASLVVVADALARTALESGELPVGVLTALVGGPFFLVIFRLRRGGAA